MIALYRFLPKHYFITDWYPFLHHFPYLAWLAHFSIVCNARMERWQSGRREVEGNHGSLPPFPYYLLFFLINLCPPPVVLLYERRANTWLDLRAAELGRFNILILFYCPAVQSQTRWLYWHVLLRWHTDEQAGTKGKSIRRNEKGKNGFRERWKEWRRRNQCVCACVELVLSIAPLLEILNILHLKLYILLSFHFTTLLLSCHISQRRASALALRQTAKLQLQEDSWLMGTSQATDSQLSTWEEHTLLIHSLTPSTQG